MSFEYKIRPQLLGESLPIILAETEITDLRSASNIVTLLENIAANDASQYFKMRSIIRNYNLDSTTGVDLDNRAIEIMGAILGKRREATKASGYVTIGDSSFSKISTKIYSGLNGPITNMTTVFVDDASSFPASGDLIIGRNADNTETIAYTSITTFANYYRFNLAAPLTKDHGNEEDVIYSQGGNRTVEKGKTVKVPESDNSFEVIYSTQEEITLLDGEEEVIGVSVVCDEAGAAGNAGIGEISTFVSDPFVNATVTNPSKLVNGYARETDNELRDRIKTYLATLSRGTSLALKGCLQNLYSEEDNKRITSVNLIDVTSTDSIAHIFIDDGAGLEASFDSTADEVLMESAEGGETFFRLLQYPLVKAQVACLNVEPFNIAVGETIIIKTNDTQETITFVSSDFITSGSVYAKEISKAINSRSSLAECRTFNEGTQVFIKSKSNENEYVQIDSGSTAIGVAKLNMPTSEVQTLLLYKINADGATLLRKDGVTASIESPAIAGTIDTTAIYNFKYQVDGKKTLTVDLRDAGSGGDYSGTYLNDAAVTLTEIVAALNDVCPGITASLSSTGNKITITSNTELSSSSGITIFNAAGNDINAGSFNFSLVPVLGYNKDYTLNRFNGQLELTTPLELGDKLVAGTSDTRAFLMSTKADIFDLSGGSDITFSIDSGAGQTVTFVVGDFVDITAATTAEVIYVLNRDLQGSTAEDVDGYIKIRTNNYNAGDIQVTAVTANGNDMGFSTDIVSNLESHIAYQTSTATGPFTLLETDNLILVLDNDSQDKTYDITMGVMCKVVIGDAAGPFDTFTSKFDITDLGIGTQFTDENDLIGMNIKWTSGANIGEEQDVTAYDPTTHEITCAAAFTNAIATDDEFYIIPQTAKNVATYINNTITGTFSLKGICEALDDDSVQISTLTVGETGQVNIIGGTANTEFVFSTNTSIGKAGYGYYTGIVRKAQRTIDGLESGQIEYPGYKATGAQVEVDCSAIYYVSVEISGLEVSGRSNQTVINEIKNAVSSYINSLKIGDNVIINEIIKVVKSVSGVVDFTLVTPAANITISANQTAKARAGDIIVG